MSADKEILEQLSRKIDDLTIILKEISEDLKATSASLKSLAVSQITKPAVSAPSTSSPTPKPVVRVTTSSTQPVSKPTLRPTATAPAPKPATPTPSAEPAAPTQLESVDVRMMFPQDLDSMLAFEDKGSYVQIKPKQFLGSENFAKIASTVRGAGGEYISAGRDSHFRVYKKKP